MCYKKNIRIILLLSSTLFLISFSIRQENKKEHKKGKALFDKYCASCHFPTKTGTASPFPFIRQRNGKDWVYKLVKDNYKLQRVDKKARKVFKNKNNMTKFEGMLSNEDIDAICDYVDELNKKK